MLNRVCFSEEEVRYYNSAYIGFILYNSIREYLQFKPSGMHCAYPFIIIPMAVSKQVSEKLPRSYKTHLTSWVSDNASALVSLHHQAESYNPIVKASISFIMDRNLIRLTNDGLFLLGDESMIKNPSFFRESKDMNRTLGASRLLGRWFSNAGDVETVFAMLGVRP